MLYLSHFIDEKTPAYNNAARVHINHVSKIQDGNTSNFHNIILETNHIGTHIDFPYHFYEKGLKLEDFSPDFFFCNKILLIELNVKKNELITWDKISSKIDFKSNPDIIILKTGFEKFRNTVIYWKESIGIESKVAIKLRKTFPNLKFIGMDFISLTSLSHKSEGKKCHLEFLKETNDEKPILVIEDMKLDEIRKPIKKIIISPILIKGLDGAPVTVYGEI